MTTLKTEDAKFVARIPEHMGRIVSMLEYQRQILVATERGVYVLKDGYFHPVGFSVGGE